MYRAGLVGRSTIYSVRARPVSQAWTRAAPQRIISSSAIRAATSEAGDEHSGHIQAGSNEGILFFDNVFPLRLRWLLRWSFHGESRFKQLSPPGIAAFDPVNLLQKAVPEDKSFQIGDVIPRMKDGGCFIRFSHDETTSAEQVEDRVREYLKKETIRPWFNPFQHVRARLVRGRPWVEDLYRPPSYKLKVEFVPTGANNAPELSQEQLYSIFRPYGKLKDIKSQPQESKLLPRYANIYFQGKKRSIMAKNCLHGLEVPNENGGGSEQPVKLKIGYETIEKSNWFIDWLLNHPRIVLPLLAALTTIVAVNIFDPIRTLNIKLHITRAFHLTDYPLYRWFLSRARNIFHAREAEPGMHAIWDDRKDDIEQLEKWLMETADTFIVVQGPRGSGKRELVVDLALKDRKDKLVIDCKAIQEARGDAATIRVAAQQVGYRPVFSWMNSISGLIDLAAQGATGIKTGFSETLDGQLNNILNNTASALQKIVLESRHKEDKDAGASDDVWMESHPERRPVVVIDNFLHKSQEGGIIYDKIAEWAANITSANIAHVIFLTADVSYSKTLSKALPDRVFRQLSLGDCSPEVAKRFVTSRIEAEEEQGLVRRAPLTNEQKQRNLIELDESIDCLGGRLTDLEFLARRIKAGETPRRAVQEIIDQSASEILKMYIIGGDKGVSSTSLGTASASQKLWTSEQAWVLIKGLAEATPAGGKTWHGKKDDSETDAGSLRYNEVTLDSAFRGVNADATLQSLEQAELISIVVSNGRPRAIRPGKPVFLEAFKKLTADKVLRARMELALVNANIKNEVAGIEKMEGELQLLAALPKQPTEIVERERYLLQKLFGSQRSVEEMERKASELKKVLLTEY